MNKKRILYVTFTLGLGGLEKVLVNFSSELIKRGYVVDFVINPSKNDDLNRNLVLELGSKLYYLKTPGQLGIYQYVKQLTKIIKGGQYDVVHAHNEYHGWLVSLAAKLAGVKTRVIHSHTTSTTNVKLQKLMPVIRVLNQLLATEQVAVSESAGDFMFNGPFKVVNNGFDSGPYLYPNDKKTEKFKKKFKIDNSILVFGQVGRLSEEKNLEFSLSLLSKYKEQTGANFKFIIAGDGPLKNTVMTRIKEYDLKNEVVLIGPVVDIQNYFGLFDILLFPSLFEGLGLSGVEAQLGQVYVLASDTIPKEIDIGMIKFLPLSNQEDWIKELSNQPVILPKEHLNDNFEKQGFDLQSAIDKLEAIYS